MAETNNRTKILSVIPMRTQVIFPNTNVAFDAGRNLSLAAIERADLNDKLVFLVKQKNPEREIPDPEDLYDVGTVAQIRQATRLPGDRVRVYVEALYRARARDFRVENGYIYAVTDELASVHGDLTLEEAYFRTAKETSSRSAGRSPRTSTGSCPRSATSTNTSTSAPIICASARM